MNAADVMDRTMAEAIERAGWSSRVGKALGVCISVPAQRLHLILDERVVRSYPCSTAGKGVGQVNGSNQTPCGWHEIKQKIGDGLPSGAVLRRREWAGEIWRGEAVTDDLILTRIMWLGGLEPGVNQGGDVDTFVRYIYIHGTQDEANLGRPVSHGCVRMGNADVIDLFDRVIQGCRVLILDS